MQFMYLCTESTILPSETKHFNISGVLFLNMTEDTEQQDPLLHLKYHLGLIKYSFFAEHY